MRNLTNFTDAYLDSSIPKVNCPNCMSVSPEIIEATQLSSAIKIRRKCVRCHTDFSIRYPITMSIGTPQQPVSSQNDKTRYIPPVSRNSVQNTVKNQYTKSRSNMIKPTTTQKKQEVPLPVLKFDDDLFEQPMEQTVKLNQNIQRTNTVRNTPRVQQPRPMQAKVEEETVTPWGKPIKNMTKWKKKCKNDIVSDRLWHLSVASVVLISIIITFFCMRLFNDYDYSAVANIVYTLLIGVPIVCFTLFSSIVYDLKGTAFGKY